MTYFFAEDKKISGKWIRVISRSMDIMNQSASQPVSQSVCLSLADRLTQPASQSVRLSLTDSRTFINDLFRFSRYKNIRRIDSTYIRECGYKGSASQPISLPASQSVCLYLTDRLTSASRSVYLCLSDRLT